QACPRSGPESASKARCGSGVFYREFELRAVACGTSGSPGLAPAPGLERFATFRQTKSEKIRKLWDSRSAPKLRRRRPSPARASGGFQSTRLRGERRTQLSRSSGRGWSNHPIGEDARAHGAELL